MKAHIAKEGKELVLLYRIDEAEGSEALPAILQKLGLASKTIEDSQLEESVGYLSELKGYEKGGQPARNEVSWEQQNYPMMVISQVESKKMDLLLEALEQDKVQIPLKAAVTKYNSKWSFRRLIDEVTQEQRIFAAIERLEKLIQFAERSGFSSLEAKDCIQRAKGLLKGITQQQEPQPTLGEIVSVTQQLEKIITAK